MRTTFLVLLVAAIVCPVLAVTEIHQGDIVYMGEHVDISLAVSWPDYTLAWCKSDGYECEPPDQIIEVTGFMHNYYIDPDVFNYGTYYRWDGEWNRAENSVAFTIIPGKRTDPKPSTDESDISDVLDDIPNQIKTTEGPFKWLIARNDDPTAHISLQRSDTCYLWLFSNNADILHKRMNQTNATPSITEYTYHFSDGETGNLTVGTMAAYIQCIGNNKIPDVYMDGKTLDSIYNDDVVPDYEVQSWNPYPIKDKFESIIKTVKQFSSDDYFVPVTVSVEEPSIYISDVSTGFDNTRMFLSGTTNWKNQTKIKLQLDPDQYVLPYDIGFHTWETTVSGTIEAPRTFTTALSLDKDDMWVGAHEVVAKPVKDTDVGHFAYTFKVSDTYVFPTPTPETKKRLYSGSGWDELPSIDTPEPTPTPTPEPTPIPTPTFALNLSESGELPISNHSYVAVNGVIENVTVVTTTPLPIAKETIPVIPMNPGIVVLAAMIVFYAKRLRE